MKSHPSKNDLMAYAEGLDVRVATADHIAACRYCLAEVETIRQTLRIAEGAAAIEPSRTWRASLRLAVRNERCMIASSPKLYKPLAAAAVLAVVAGSALSMLRSEAPVSGRAAGSESAPELRNAAFVSLDVLRQVSPEEELLSEAVMSAERSPRTRWEEEKRRAALVFDDDIDEALAAFQSNPACVRASALVNANREKLKETLKTLYVERSL